MKDLHNVCSDVKEVITTLSNRRINTYNALVAAIELEVLLTKMEIEVGNSTDLF